MYKRQVKYILTPKGFKEKARKSSKYVLKIIREFLKYRNIIQDFIFKIYQEGVREIEIKGNGELIEVMRIVLRSMELKGLNYKISEDDCEPVIIFNGRKIKLHEIVSV